MESIRSHFFRRGVCLACAAVLLLTIVTPAARAAGPEDAASETQQLTYADAAGMAEADRAIAALTGSADYGALDADGRADAAGALLESLAADGLVQPGSLCLDAENGMYSFTYDCGVLGGILLADPDDEAGIDAGPIDAAGIPAALADPIGAENDVLPVGNAIVYYAFDDTTNSNRWPYYTIMQEYWNEWGLATTIDSEVTVADLRHMDDYDLCVLSAHGAYYSYNAGWLFRRVKTAPIVILQEESSFWDDLRYGIDLLTHRVIKVSGRYCVTPDFFRAAYRGGKLNGNIIFSETCEFFGGGTWSTSPCPPPCWTAGRGRWWALSTPSTPSTPAICCGAPSTSSSPGRTSCRRWTPRPRPTASTTSPGTSRRGARPPTGTRPSPSSTATTPPPCTPCRRRTRPQRPDRLHFFPFYTILSAAASIPGAGRTFCLD